MPASGDRPPLIAVCGASAANAGTDAVAERVGELVATRGGIVVCGGLGGVMAAAARGAARGGGLSVGILPGESAEAAAPDISLALPTGMGEMRNALIVRACSVVIAVGGAYGTLSEIALALRLGRPVVGIGTWEIRAQNDAEADPGIRRAADADEAVAIAFRLIES